MSNSKIKLYHIDRLKKLNVGMQINLFNDYTLNPESDEINRIINLHLKSIYPNGISEHAWHYLSSHSASSGNNTLCELTFEVVRSMLFFENLSRFQSFFAFDFNSLESYKEIWKYDGSNYNIYEVNAERFEKYDMTLLTGDNIIDLYYNAIKYWSGQTSNNPKYEYLLKPPVNIISKIS